MSDEPILHATGGRSSARSKSSAYEVESLLKWASVPWRMGSDGWPPWWMAVVLVEVAAAGFGLAVVAMVGELAWNLFPSSAPPLDVEGGVVLFVHRHGSVMGAALVVGHVARCSYVFAPRGPSATARLPVWGALYVCQILATTVLFFVAVYTVLSNVLPRE